MRYSIRIVQSTTAPTTEFGCRSSHLTTDQNFNEDDEDNAKEPAHLVSHGVSRPPVHSTIPACLRIAEFERRSSWSITHEHYNDDEDDDMVNRAEGCKQLSKTSQIRIVAFKSTTKHSFNPKNSYLIAISHWISNRRSHVHARHLPLRRLRMLPGQRHDQRMREGSSIPVQAVL